MEDDVGLVDGYLPDTDDVGLVDGYLPDNDDEEDWLGMDVFWGS